MGNIKTSHGSTDTPEEISEEKEIEKTTKRNISTIKNIDKLRTEIN